MKASIEKFKRDLAVVFDDNLHTKKWHNIVDYIIIALIIISTAEIFISTFDINPGLRQVLEWTDITILIIFTVEVSLRIWVAPLLNPRYKGWKGRIRYCSTFNGFIDAVSTYPFYLQAFVPFPITWLATFRAFRVVRLFRVSRYMKSWRLLDQAFKEKKRELFISLQFLVVITLILSLILYFCEHNAQPDAYDNGISSVLWAFAQYIGDPGGFGDNKPITGVGKAIACIVGLLGIAIVAVPAGILGAGFTEAIEKESNKKSLEENREKIRLSFECQLDRPTGYQIVPPYRTLIHIQARQGMSPHEIISAVNETPGYRLVNLAATRPYENYVNDVLAVEHFSFNTPYGLLIDRNSPITIIAPASFIDDCSGFFAYYLAKIGGFNLTSREFGIKAPYRSYYILKDGPQEKGEAEYMSDVEKLLSRPGAWSITFLIASGANEPEYPTQIHIGTGNKKGDTSIGPLIHDKLKFSDFYNQLAATVAEKFDYKCDCGIFHSFSNPNLIFRRLNLPAEGNHIIMRMAWSVALWDSRRILLAQTIARILNSSILGISDNPEDKTLTIKKIGFE